MTQDNVGTLKSSRESKQLASHVKGIEQQADDARRRCGGRIGTIAQQLTLIPALAESMTHNNRGDKVDDLLRMGQSIGRDVDVLAQEHQAISTRYEDIKRHAPTKKNHLGRHNRDCLAIGREYLQLDERVTRAILPSLSQLLDIAGVDVVREDNRLDVVNTTTNETLKD